MTDPATGRAMYVFEGQLAPTHGHGAHVARGGGLGFGYVRLMLLPIEGGCRCDELRIRVKSAPLMTMACHCRGCQRMSSSAFSLTAIFEADAFEVTKGKPVIGGLHNADAQHFFCAHCMTWMFTRAPAVPHIVNVRPTMFDDHAWFAPFAETFTQTKLPWAVTGATHAFAEFPPMTQYEALMAEFRAVFSANP